MKLFSQIRVRLQPLLLGAAAIVLVSSIFGAGEAAAGHLRAIQNTDQLTPMQREIARQRQRLRSDDVEERRSALMRLSNLKRPDAARVAVAGLSDSVPIVRVTAAHAIMSLPPAEAATLLLPLLQDKLEFVRREAAYSLGETRSRSAVAALTNILASDKEMTVRGAAATALGQIGDEAAAPALIEVLAGQPGTKKKAKGEPNDFLKRAAAHSLGRIKSRTGVAVLITTLSNEANDTDVRREAATALGMIGDTTAVPTLQAAFSSSDPYLSEAAGAALKRIKLAAK
jgi:HEAT repeat protein